MKRTLITTLIIIIIIGIWSLFVTPKETPKGPEQKTKEVQNLKKRVKTYLENSSLISREEGQIFADYHKFDKKDGELFIWAYIAKYDKQNGGLNLASGYSGPVVITLGEEGKIANHWTPRDGKEYSISIKKKFPQEYVNEVLHFQAQHKDTLNELQESTRRKAEEKLTRKEADIILKPGATETIKLEANRTTGYKWHYNIENENVIEIASDEYQEKEHEEGVVGTGGNRIVEIKGVKEGHTVIKFEYYREWEPEDAEETKEIKVEVKRGNESGPQIQNTEYISIQNKNVQTFNSEENYPADFRVVEGEIKCPSTSSAKTIGGEKYCFSETSEGAAGTIYKDYAYATVINNSLIMANFTIEFPQCGNYPEPSKSECEEEHGSFEPDKLADKLIKNANP